MIPLTASTESVLLQEPAVARFFAPVRNLLVSWFGEGIVAILGVALGILFTLAIGKVFLTLLRRFLKRSFARSRKITSLMASFIIKVVTTVGWTIVGIMCLQQMGINMVPVITGLGITGVIVGLAFQESIGNLLAGVMIVINEPFRIGDYIEAGSFSGTVLSMDMMCIMLATPDNKHITLSNRVVWSAPIVNYSFTDSRRIDMKVNVPYGTDLVSIRKVVGDLLGQYPEILADPKPLIEVGSLDDSTVSLWVRPWVIPSDYWKVFFRFQADMYERLPEEGIDAPHSMLNVRLFDSTGHEVPTRVGNA